MIQSAFVPEAGIIFVTKSEYNFLKILFTGTQADEVNFFISCWELLPCNRCSYKRIHIGCGKLAWDVADWQCKDCRTSEVLLVEKNFQFASSSSMVAIADPDRLSALKRSHPDKEQHNFSEDDSDSNPAENFRLGSMCESNL